MLKRRQRAERWGGDGGAVGFVGGVRVVVYSFGGVVVGVGSRGTIVMDRVVKRTIIGGGGWRRLSGKKTSVGWGCGYFFW